MEEELYARLEDYLDNTLSLPERAALEAEVQADPQLAERLAHLREARERLNRQWAQETADQALVKNLQQIGNQHFNAQATPKKLPAAPSFQLRRWWPAWAAAACLTALLLWIFSTSRQPDLYAQYRRFPEAAFVTRAGGNPSQTTLAAAETAFNAGQYAHALLLLQQHLAEQPNDLEARYFSALCQLELGQTTAATTTLQQLQTAPAYADEALWYLALTALKEKNRAQATTWLRQIPPDSPHYNTAQKVLKEV